MKAQFHLCVPVCKKFFFLLRIALPFVCSCTFYRKHPMQAFYALSHIYALSIEMVDVIFVQTKHKYFLSENSNFIEDFSIRPAWDAYIWSSITNKKATNRCEAVSCLSIVLGMKALFVIHQQGGSSSSCCPNS